jgi:hypothetical protein
LTVWSMPQGSEITKNLHVCLRSQRKMYLSPSCGSMRLFIVPWYRSGLAQSTSFRSLWGRCLSKARLPERSSNSTIPKDQISLCRVKCPVWIYSGAAYSNVPSTWQTWKTKPWDQKMNTWKLMPIICLLHSL